MCSYVVLCVHMLSYGFLVHPRSHKNKHNFEKRASDLHIFRRPPKMGRAKKWCHFLAAKLGRKMRRRTIHRAPLWETCNMESPTCSVGEAQQLENIHLSVRLTHVSLHRLLQGSWGMMASPSGGLGPSHHATMTGLLLATSSAFLSQLSMAPLEVYFCSAPRE